jgi:NAD(P)-dependent dehydrogenase (short-subunit alcohol dehydrogenase family)
MNPLRVIITGAAGGLGSALALQLARQNASLLLLDKASGDLDALSDRICAQGLDKPGICPLDLAISGPEEFKKLVEIMQQEYGGLDAVIHCAAAFHGLQPMDQVPTDQWLECMQVNVNAVWLLTISCLPLLKSSGRGRVIFIQDDEQTSGSAYWGAYGTSKAAMSSLGRILDAELSGMGVQVLNFYPGPMKTALRARAYLAENPQSLRLPAAAAEEIIREMENSFTNEV